MTLEQVIGRFVLQAEQQRLDAWRNGNPMAMHAAELTVEDVARAVRQIVGAEYRKSHNGPAVAGTTARA